jgi:ABC-type multidrug transport system ATPase subunit
MSAKKAASTETVLDVQSLVHRYGLLKTSIANRTPVLNDVSFDVKEGEVLGLLGPNGAGKTTCIRCITGEETPHRGSVAVKANSPAGAFIGLCPQETVLAKDLTVSENLRLLAVIRGATDEEADSFIDRFLILSHLQEKRDEFPESLSGGMKRRLSVACALIAAPSVAILDEPTTGLDPMSRRGIWTTIYEIKAAGSCCLLTTHMLEEAEALCSNVVVLKQGSVVANGSVQQLKVQWSTGYRLSIDSKPGEKETAKKFLADYLPCEDSEPVRETSDGQMTFRLNISEEALGRLIAAIGEGKKTGGISHWGVSQASLEDTYLQIIQSEPDSVAAAEALPA